MTEMNQSGSVRTTQMTSKVPRWLTLADVCAESKDALLSPQGSCNSVNDRLELVQALPQQVDQVDSKQCYVHVVT